tara:strand:+ start:34 stop:180 length:147 start_codon:yes stop_codon:yes gene_type:complete
MSKLGKKIAKLKNTLDHVGYKMSASGTTGPSDYAKKMLGRGRWSKKKK